MNMESIFAPDVPEKSEFEILRHIAPCEDVRHRENQTHIFPTRGKYRCISVFYDPNAPYCPIDIGFGYGDFQFKFVRVNSWPVYDRVKHLLQSVI